MIKAGVVKWLKVRIYFFVRNVDTNQLSGLDSVLPVKHGMPLLRNQRLESEVRLQAVLDIRQKLPNRCCCHRFIQVMRNADQQEFRNLTGFLAVVLCRDPLC